MRASSHTMFDVSTKCEPAGNHMQAKAKIMVVRDIERDDIEYISKTLNCLPIAHVDHMKLEKLGHADRVDEVQVSQAC